jgi:NADH-quinone oxidoreductase subunit C
MISIDNNYLLEQISGKLGAGVLNSSEPYDMLTIEVSKDDVRPLFQFLKDHKEIQMNFLTTLCGFHQPEQRGKELGVIYHMHSWVNNIRLRVKCFVPVKSPNVPSVADIYASANWQERETYDFFGIIFEGHPDLRRILNVDHMTYFPLRKEYPLEDATRDDKQDKFFGR